MPTWVNLRANRCLLFYMKYYHYRNPCFQYQVLLALKMSQRTNWREITTKAYLQIKHNMTDLRPEKICEGKFVSLILLYISYSQISQYNTGKERTKSNRKRERRDTVLFPLMSSMLGRKEKGKVWSHSLGRKELSQRNCTYIKITLQFLPNSR